MFAAHHKLDNLCLIVDSNGLQIDGPVAEVAGPEPIDEKFRAFGFDVQTIDGNNFDDIERAFTHAKTVQGKPSERTWGNRACGRGIYPSSSWDSEAGD